MWYSGIVCERKSEWNAGMCTDLFWEVRCVTVDKSNFESRKKVIICRFWTFVQDLYFVEPSEPCFCMSVYVIIERYSDSSCECVCYTGSSRCVWLYGLSTVDLGKYFHQKICIFNNDGSSTDLKKIRWFWIGNKWYTCWFRGSLQHFGFLYFWLT